MDDDHEEERSQTPAVQEAGEIQLEDYGHRHSSEPYIKTSSMADFYYRKSAGCLRSLAKDAAKTATVDGIQSILADEDKDAHRKIDEFENLIK
jgi:hypothetical protein